MLNRFQSTAWADSLYKSYRFAYVTKTTVGNITVYFCCLYMSYSVLCLNKKDVSVIQ